MAKSKDINRGDWINIPGVGTVQVTRASQGGPGRPFEIDWKKGSKSGVLIRSGDLTVKKVHGKKAKS